MGYFTFVMTITYPTDAHEKETDNQYSWIDERTEAIAALGGLQLDRDCSYSQPEEWHETANAYLRSDTWILHRPVTHVKSVAALSKYLEGWADMLRILTSCEVSYYYQDDDTADNDSQTE